MINDWEKPYEDDGVTLGPEDALHREIQKSKTLKVEKLKLKDTVQKLKAENDDLLKNNQSLKQKLDSFTGQSSPENKFSNEQFPAVVQTDQTPNIRWSFFLLFFNLIALGILLILLLK